jgi:hypothetical protein
MAGGKVVPRESWWTRASRRPWVRFAGGVAVFVALLAAWAGLIWQYHDTAVRNGWEVSKPQYRDLAPLYASLDPPTVRARQSETWTCVAWASVALATAWVTVGLISRRSRLMPTLVAGVCLAAAINYATASLDGPGSITRPFERDGLEYFGDVPIVGGEPAAFLARYPKYVEGARIGWRGRLSHHARTHPPGGVLTLWAVAGVFDPSVQTASYAAILISALGLVPATLLVREIAGRRAGEVAMALYLATPSLVLFGATCMDGVFAVPIVTALWLGERALRGRWWATALIAIASGVALGAGMLMTFAAAPCIGILWLSRVVFEAAALRWRVLLRLLIAGPLAALVAVALIAWLQRATGYDMVANLKGSLAVDERFMGTGTEPGRYLDLSIANLLAFCIGVGGATLALATFSLGRSTWRAVRRRSTFDSAGWAHVVGIVAIAFSTMFTLEVERIWLFLIPSLLATAAIPIARLPRPQRAIATAACVLLLYAQTWTTELIAKTHW